MNPDVIRYVMDCIPALAAGVALVVALAVMLWVG